MSNLITGLVTGIKRGRKSAAGLIGAVLLASWLVQGIVNNPQIALKNIRERLDLMCKGTLTIDSGEEGGTVVTIRIPGQAEDREIR